MENKQPLHDIQLQILNKLIFAENLTFSKLKPSREMENNQFNFHLRKLLDAGHIKKFGLKYSLTLEGKEFCHRMDTETSKVPLQAKLSAWVCCRRQAGTNNTDDSNIEYLIGTRKKHPFFGKQGFIAGKIRLGESVIEAAKRELLEETGLTAEPKLVLIRHYRVFEETSKKLLEDKFMFLFRAEEPVGQVRNNEEVELEWVSANELAEKVTNAFEGFDALHSLIQIVEDFTGTVSFDEIDFYTSTF